MQTPQTTQTTLASRPSADAIAKSYVHGESPLDFVKKNLEKLRNGQVSSPNQPEQDTSIASDATATSAGEADATNNNQTSPKDVEESKVVDAQTPEMEMDAKDTSAENIKNLRKGNNELKSKLKEKETALETAQKQLEQYQKGEVLPEKLQELQNEVSRLSKFEEMVSLESSHEYHEKYVVPLSDAKTKLKTILKDYDIPDDRADLITNQMLQAKPKELNAYLSEQFDTAGILEIKGVINGVKALQDAAEAAKKTPKEALAKLIDEAAQTREVTQTQQRTKIKTKANSAWFKSLSKIQEERSIPELIIHENNTEFNEKVSKPIITHAAKEYGIMISKLADAGLSNLPDDLSDAIANMVLLAHASSVSIAQRDNAVNRFNELERTARRETQYTRPPIGGQFGTAPSSPVQNRPTNKPVGKQFGDLANSIVTRNAR